MENIFQVIQKDVKIAFFKFLGRIPSILFFAYFIYYSSEKLKKKTMYFYHFFKCPNCEVKIIFLIKYLIFQEVLILDSHSNINKENNYYLFISERFSC